MLRANHYHPGIRLTTNDYVKLADPLHLREFGVQIISRKHLGSIKPFADWADNQPTQSLKWYDAYNDTKHDREQNLGKATLRTAIEATAALYLMGALQFGFDESEVQQDLFVLSAGPNLEDERYWPAKSSTGETTGV
jgi:hypothetical protein